MTSIAWDGTTLAADGRCTKGNIIGSDHVAKIFVDVHSQVRGSTVIAYALAGSADMQHRIGKWIEEGCEVSDEFKECNFECIIITEDDAYMFCSESNDICTTFGKQALGSGYDFILSAMHLGKNAVKAVQHAASLDIFSGGTGTYINCRKRKLELKEFQAS